MTNKLTNSLFITLLIFFKYFVDLKMNCFVWIPFPSKVLSLCTPAFHNGGDLPTIAIERPLSPSWPLGEVPLFWLSFVFQIRLLLLHSERRKMFLQEYYEGSPMNDNLNLKPRANGRNFVDQQLPTLLDQLQVAYICTLCCCCMLLRVVGSCCARFPATMFGVCT